MSKTCTMTCRISWILEERHAIIWSDIGDNQSKRINPPSFHCIPDFGNLLSRQVKVHSLRQRKSWRLSRRVNEGYKNGKVEVIYWIAVKKQFFSTCGDDVARIINRVVLADTTTNVTQRVESSYLNDDRYGRSSTYSSSIDTNMWWDDADSDIRTRFRTQDIMRFNVTLKNLSWNHALSHIVVSLDTT